MGVESVRIPRIEIHAAHTEVTKPTHDSPEGSILTKLRNAHTVDRNHLVVASSPHFLINVPPPLPHHPNGSQVLWHSSTGDDNQIEPWHNPGGWYKLAHNREYIDKVEEHARTEVKKGASVYFMFGWSPYNNQPQTGFMRQSAQTQIRPHEHLRSSLADVPITDYIELTQSADLETLRKFSIYMDFGSPLIRKHFSELRDFASAQATWFQNDGQVQRHAFGFLSLHDALSQLVGLHVKLHPIWKEEMAKLYEEWHQEYKDPTQSVFQSLLLFPPGVSASAFFPNADDKRMMGIPDNDPHSLWVSFGTPLSKTTTVDGVWLDRK